MPKDGKRDEDVAGDGGGGEESVACGKILRPVHVKTRLLSITRKFTS